MARRQVRDERRAAERHRLAVVQHLVDRMRLAARLHRLKRRHVLGHRHHLRAGQLLDHGIAFLVVAVRVAAEQDLDVGELEPELLDRLLNRRHVALVVLLMRMLPCGVTTRNAARLLVPT